MIPRRHKGIADSMNTILTNIALADSLTTTTRSLKKSTAQTWSFFVPKPHPLLSKAAVMKMSPNWMQSMLLVHLQAFITTIIWQIHDFLGGILAPTGLEDGNQLIFTCPCHDFAKDNIKYVSRKGGHDLWQWQELTKTFDWHFWPQYRQSSSSHLWPQLRVECCA